MKTSAKSRLIGVIQDTAAQIGQAQLLMAASSLAYTTILSIIPLLAMSFSIFKAFGGLQQLESKITPLILENLTEGASEEAIRRIHSFIENIHAGALGTGGLIGLIFTSMSLLFSAEKAINRVWAAPMQRGLFQRVSGYWLLLTLGPLGLSFALGASAVPGALVSIAIFYSVYKWVPHRAVHWRSALIAAVVTSLAWNIARVGYAAYTTQVLTYSKIYGSLAAIPIILLWIYIMWVIILAGAALSAALQKRIER